MIRSIISSSKRFYNYQKIRFPIIVLSFSLLPAILGTAALFAVHASIVQIVGVLIASILYLLHIRVVDEQRDLNHDNKHHKLRPIQAGDIPIKDLQIIDIYSVTIFLSIAIYAGINSFLIGALMIFYTYLAGQDFFTGEKLRQHFFVYNGINIIQMFLLQIFAYSVFSGTITVNNLLILHFIFTSIGTIVFEFLRKLKIPGTDGTGKDTYSWYLGFDNALIVYILFVLLNTFFFYQVMIIIAGEKTLWLSISAVLFFISLFFSLVHFLKKAIQTEQMMQLSFLIVYAIFNLIIYFKGVSFSY